MKIGFLKNFALAALAAVTLLACEKDKSVRPTVDIQSDESFNEDHTAQVTIVLSSAIKKDLTVNLAVSSLSAPGTTAVPGSHLQFPATVTIAAEATSVTFTAILNPDGLSADTYSAGIQVLGGNGYYVNKDGGITYIKFDGSSYSGGGGSEGEGGGGEEGGNKDLSLQTNWSVSLDGDPYYYDGDPYIDLTINAPGIQYFYVEANSDAELAQWYGGTLAGLVKNWEDDNLERLAAGSAISDVLFSLSDTEFYMDYTDAGPTKVYLVEFDAQGKATGRYSVTDVVLPEIGDDPGGGEEDEFIPELLGPLKFQSSWTAQYGGMEDDYHIITISGVTDPIFMFDLYGEAIPDADLEDELIDMVSYNINEYGYAYEGPSDYDGYYSFPINTFHTYIAGMDEDFNLTGNWGHSIVTVPASAVSSVKMRIKSFHMPRHPLKKKRIK